MPRPRPGPAETPPASLRAPPPVEGTQRRQFGRVRPLKTSSGGCCTLKGVCLAWFLGPAKRRDDCTNRKPLETLDVSRLDRPRLAFWKALTQVHGFQLMAVHLSTGGQGQSRQRDNHIRDHPAGQTLFQTPSKRLQVHLLAASLSGMVRPGEGLEQQGLDGVKVAGLTGPNVVEMYMKIDGSTCGST